MQEWQALSHALGHVSPLTMASLEIPDGVRWQPAQPHEARLFNARLGKHVLVNRETKEFIHVLTHAILISRGDSM